MSPGRAKRAGQSLAARLALGTRDRTAEPSAAAIPEPFSASLDPLAFPPASERAREGRGAAPTSYDRGHVGERRRLFTSFTYLVAKQGATAALGLVYWVLATRLFSTRDVGLAAAAASTAAFLAAIGALGVPILLVAELGALEPPKRRAALTTGLAVTGLAVLVLSLGTVALSPALGKSLRVIGQDPVKAGLLVIGSVATVAGITFENAAIGLHRGSVQLLRGSLSSALKIACVGGLVLADTKTSAGLLFAWALGLAASVVLCFPFLGLERSAQGEGTIRHRWQVVRRYGTLSLKHHVLNLSINSISYLVPLIAALLIRPRQVAYFSTAFLLSTTVMIIPYLLTLALFAERSGDDDQLRRHVRRTLPVGLALCATIVVIVQFAAPFVLRIFGPLYAANGTTALRLLVLVGPSYVIKDHLVVIRRAQGRLTEAAKVMALGTSFEVAGAVAGAVLGGMVGLCLGWAVAASIEASLLAPGVLRVFRGESGHAGPDPAEREGREGTQTV